MISCYTYLTKITVFDASCRFFISSGSGLYFGPTPLESFDSTIKIRLLMVMVSFLNRFLASTFSLAREEKSQTYIDTISMYMGVQELSFETDMLEE